MAWFHIVDFLGIWTYWVYTFRNNVTKLMNSYVEQSAVSILQRVSHFLHPDHFWPRGEYGVNPLVSICSVLRLSLGKPLCRRHPRSV